MIRFLQIIILIAILTSCENESKTYKKLAAIESMTHEKLYDKALKEINAINEKEINDDRDRAYYNLLKTKIHYISELPALPDSVINFSIKYYKNTSNDKKLAKAYYYKGATLGREQRMKDAIIALKEGERHAKIAEDSITGHHLAENIAFINSKTGNNHTALIYAHKALKLSEGIGRKAWVAEDCQRIAAIYGSMGSDDSCKLYLKKALKYIEHAPKELKAELYANAGAFHFDNGNMAKAMDNVIKSLNIMPSAEGFYMLGSIYLKQGETDKAWEVWNKALNTNDLELKATVMGWMAEMKRKQGEYKDADLWTGRMNAVKDSLRKAQQSEDILLMQSDMERNEAKKESDKKQYWVDGLIIASLGLLFIAIYYKYKIRKSKKLATENELTITENEIRIKQKEQQLGELKKSINSHKQEINKLMSQNKNLKSEHTTILSIGYRLNNELENGGTAVKWSKKDFEAYVEYLRIEHPGVVENIEKNNKGLTAYNIFFLILCNNGVSRNEIQRIMGMTQVAVRTLTYRLKKKEKNSESE